jgi:hypothetical protein
VRAAVVYESMYTNTHQIAEQIADGLRSEMDASILPAPDDDRPIDGVDLLVVGGPTHAHGMSRRATRRAALDQAGVQAAGVTVDPDAAGPGVRDWLSSLAMVDVSGAAFDTRVQARPWLTGRASKAIAKRLHETGCSLIAPPESFLVTKDNQLVVGELERARAWGADLARTLATRPPIAPYVSTGISRGE